MRLKLITLYHAVGAEIIVLQMHRYCLVKKIGLKETPNLDLIQAFWSVLSKATLMRH